MAESFLRGRDVSGGGDVFVSVVIFVGGDDLGGRDFLGGGII